MTWIKEALSKHTETYHVPVCNANTFAKTAKLLDVVDVEDVVVVDVDVDDVDVDVVVAVLLVLVVWVTVPERKNTGSHWQCFVVLCCSATCYAMLLLDSCR